MLSAERKITGSHLERLAMVYLRRRGSRGVARVEEGSCVTHGILRLWRMQAKMRYGRAVRSWRGWSLS